MCALLYMRFPFPKTPYKGCCQYATSKRKANAIAFVPCVPLGPHPMEVSSVFTTQHCRSLFCGAFLLATFIFVLFSLICSVLYWKLSGSHPRGETFLTKTTQTSRVWMAIWVWLSFGVIPHLTSPYPPVHQLVLTCRRRGPGPGEKMVC